MQPGQRIAGTRETRLNYLTRAFLCRRARGEKRIQNMIRGLLLGWLNVVLRVRRYLQGSAGLETYDLVNAGPRHRFSSARFIVSNCLGLGFGMGARKFEDYARANGGDVSSSEAKAIVTSFRAGNQKIVQFWNRLDNLIVTACRDKSHDLGLVMPSGDLLKYFSIKSKMRGYEGYTTKGDFGHQSRQPRLWGGTLCENVTQRVARDVLAEAVVNLEEAGLPVAYTVHDEVILELDNDGSKEEAAREAVRILTTPPAWCSDLPLAVEGNFADSYTK